MSDQDLTEQTLLHYESRPEEFWEGTKDHDVSQNYENFLKNITSSKPLKFWTLAAGQAGR